MTTDNIIPIELDDFEYIEDGGYPGFRITGINLRDDNLVISFKVYFGKGSLQNGNWEILVTNYRDYRVRLEWFEFFKTYDVHPLLLEYTENSTELYFSSKAADVNKLTADIYRQHSIHCGAYIPIEKFLNHRDLFDVCSASFGLFAKGPVSIMTQYMKVLEANGIVSNLCGDIEPKYWDGEKYIEESSRLNVLTMEDNYVIGEQFIFKKLEGSAP